MGCMAADLDDTNLLRQRDAASWDALYTATGRRTYRVLYHVTGAKPNVLEELNQEVWLSAIESIERFDASRGSAHDWVLGIARFKGLTYLRKQYTSRLAYVGTGAELDHQWADASDSESDSRMERLALLRASIESLPENWQYVLRQKYEVGMSVKEISELVGVTPKAIESTLARARTRLRELYLETCEKGTDK